MKCDNLFIDSCPVGCISKSHPVLRFTPIGPVSSVCKNTELWLSVCSIGYRLLNAYVLNVSDPQMLYSVCERDSVISVLPDVA